jgi:hypothetical protein
MSLPLRTARIFWIKRTVLWLAAQAAAGDRNQVNQKEKQCRIMNLKRQKNYTKMSLIKSNFSGISPKQSQNRLQIAITLLAAARTAMLIIR